MKIVVGAYIVLLASLVLGNVRQELTSRMRSEHELWDRLFHGPIGCKLGLIAAIYRRTAEPHCIDAVRKALDDEIGPQALEVAVDKDAIDKLLNPETLPSIVRTYRRLSPPMSCRDTTAAEYVLTTTLTGLPFADHLDMPAILKLVRDGAEKHCKQNIAENGKPVYTKPASTSQGKENDNEVEVVIGKPI